MTLDDIAILDLESQSGIDLTKVGVARYAGHWTTRVLCLSYCLGRAPVQSWQPGEASPQPLLDHIAAGGIVAAWNVGFDFNVWNACLASLFFWPRIEIAQCHDIAAQAASASLPRGLENCASALGLPMNKDKDGQKALRILMKPIAAPRRRPQPGEILPRPWSFVGGRLTPTFNTDPALLAKLRAYCETDTAVEREAFARLPSLQECDRPVMLADLAMNARGLRIDPVFLRVAPTFLEEARAEADQAMRDVTGGLVPAVSNTAALDRWLLAQGIDALAAEVGDDEPEEDDESEEAEA